MMDEKKFLLFSCETYGMRRKLRPFSTNNLTRIILDSRIDFPIYKYSCIFILNRIPPCNASVFTFMFKKHFLEF